MVGSLLSWSTMPSSSASEISAGRVTLTECMPASRQAFSLEPTYAFSLEHHVCPSP